MLHLQHPITARNEFYQVKRRFERRLYNESWVLWEFVRCRMDSVFRKGISSKSNIIATNTEKHFQIMEDFNALYGGAYHRASHNFKMKCSTTKRISSNPKHSSYFSNCICSILLLFFWLYKKLSLLHLYWSGECKVIYMKHIISYMICVIRVHTLDTRRPSESTVSVVHRLVLVRI